MKIVHCLGYNVFSDSLEKIKLVRNDPKVLSTISPNSYGIATKDLRFQQSLKNSDFLVLDGVYFGLGSIINSREVIKKNQGPDVFDFYMNYLNNKRGKAFFLGSTKEVLNGIKKRSSIEYPNINIEYFSPPFKSVFSELENKQMIKKINDFNPNIVFIGMTCPKQEKWAHEHGKKLKTDLICSIGAVFNWYSGDQNEIHPLWWKLRLAWFKRTIDRPEIIKRYPNIGIFFYHLLLSLFGIKKYE